MKNQVALSYLGLLVQDEDMESLPREIRVFAGEGEHSLRLIQTIQLSSSVCKDSHAQQFCLLERPEDPAQVYRLAFVGAAAGTRFRSLVVRGTMAIDAWNRSGYEHEDETNIIKRVEVSTNKGLKKFLTDARVDTFW